MSKILDEIAKAQGGQAIPNLARQLGISESEARAAIEAALPALVAGIERNTLSRGGLADLVKALGQGHHEQVLERPDVYRAPEVQQDGLGILGHILGSESRAKGLAVQTAKATGLSDSIIQMLLPILAQMLMGALSRWLKGGLGDIVAKLPGGVQIPGGGQQPPPSQRRGSEGGYGQGFELPKVDVPQGGFPMPPMPGGSGGTPPPGGFPMPWPTGPATGGSPGGAPLPLPGPQSDSGQNPYGDLSDILRRGGGDVGSPRGGGIGGSIRDIIGNGLGFQSKGILSWILRAVVLRFGWSILKRVLGRVVTGR